MKIGLLLGTLLPLVLLPACGGDSPNKSKPASNAGANTYGSGAGSTGGAPAGSKVGEPAKPAVGAQNPKPKRIRKPKVNMALVKAVMANEPPAPKASVESTPALVALGKALYHSEHLSKNGNQSCASCHDLATYGVDNKPTSPGSDGKNGERNSPSTYNAARQTSQFWDARAKSVEEQAIMPVINPIEHGLADEAEVIIKIKEKDELVAGFAKAFPGESEPVTAKNFGVAIGAFERTLVTRSKWDDYLEGNKRALSNLELLGLKTFMDVGCTTCHMTRTLGGHMVQKLGLLKPYSGKDTGRMQVTGNAADKYIFKVPGLLNVAKTAPYYHDGSIKTLAEAVNDMADIQLGKQLKPEQTEAIVAFLGALTGEIPAEFAKAK